MKRVLLPLAVLAGLALPGSAAAAAHSSAKLTNCRSSLQFLDRSFDLTAGMRKYKGTKRMAIRFDVFERRPGGVYTALRAAGYGSWIHQPLPARRTYRYLRTVNGLEAPATYRVRVGFRWYGKGGKVQKTTSRVTHTCRQADLRPDLRIRSVTVLPAKKAGKSIYEVVVHNAGRTAAGPFSLRLFFPGGTGPGPFDFTAGLAPGKSARHIFRGAPACRSGAPTAVVDSGAVVDESDEQNNARLVVCPTP